MYMWLELARSSFVNGPRPYVGVSYSDNRESLKGGYLCNWIFHNVITDVTMFFNILLWPVEPTYL
jgi:hypothetical protein